MLYIFGTHAFGKVDQVPGLFYVVTTFFHINYVPLIPTGSYLTLDDGSNRGASIGLSLKSVVVAWVRAFLIVAGGLLIIFGLIAVGEVKKPEQMPFTLIVPGAGAVMVVMFFVSYRLTHASRDRAVYLAECAKLDPAFVHDFFDNRERGFTAEDVHGRHDDRYHGGSDRYDEERPHYR